MRYGETAVVRLRPRSVLGSFGVMLISCKVNFSRGTISFAEFSVSTQCI